MIAPLKSLRQIGTATLCWLTLLLPGLTPAADIELPDIGLSASASIPEEDENQYARQLLRAMRNAGVLVEDPLLEEYLRTTAIRLAEVSEKPEQRYIFVMLRNRELNAFATPGGLIAVHTGLISAAETESEMAAVLAHEIAHVTQKHIVRAMESARKAQWPMMLATLAAMALAKDSEDKAGAMIAGTAALQQMQINFTRANEFEADRLGIRTLKRAGFDVNAMATMFGRLQRATVIAPEEAPPEFLRTHPLSNTRIAEAKARAVELGADQVNPVSDSAAYRWMRARVKVIEADDPLDAERQFQQTLRERPEADDQRYGIVVAALARRDVATATRQLRTLRATPENELALALARAELGKLQGGDWRRAYEALSSSHPGHRVVTRAFADALLETGKPEAGRRTVELIKPLVARIDNDPALYELLGRGYELDGDEIRAGESHARAHALRGAFEDALLQLQSLAQRPRLDYYQRARLDAQIAELTPVVIYLRERYGKPQQQLQSAGQSAARSTMDAVRQYSIQ